MKDIEPKKAKYVGLSNIVPEDWRDWFFNDITENAPFSWGDNDVTLVEPRRFMEHALEVLDFVYESEDDNKEVREDIIKNRDAFIDTLKYLSAKNILIDLEN